jgi:hypothetical protein
MDVVLKVPKTQAHISCTETGESLISVLLHRAVFTMMKPQPHSLVIPQASLPGSRL